MDNENQEQIKGSLFSAFEIKSSEIKSDDSGEFGYFTGYASTFGNVDRTNDIIQPNAFTKSLQTRKPKMYWQHMMSKPIGSFPVIQEDAKGLYVEGRINLGTSLGKDAYALVKAKDIDSMSIGYVANKYEIDEKTGTRSLKELDLWEISLVSEPANTAAMITSVKSIEEAKSLADIEKILRDYDFSKKDAKILISRIKQISSERDAEDVAAEREALNAKNDEAVGKLVAEIRQLTNQYSKYLIK